MTPAIPDPVRSGLVASLGRPGGQLTGISNPADELVPKRLQLLKDVLPAARQIAIARCPACLKAAGASDAEEEGAARLLGVSLLTIDVNAAGDFDKAASTLRRERPDALLIGATQINAALRNQWIEFAAE